MQILQFFIMFFYNDLFGKSLLKTVSVTKCKCIKLKRFPKTMTTYFQRIRTSSPSLSISFFFLYLFGWLFLFFFFLSLQHRNISDISISSFFLHNQNVTIHQLSKPMAACEIFSNLQQNLFYTFIFLATYTKFLDIFQESKL